MGLQGYVGNAEDQKRIARYEKQRQEKAAEFEKQKKQSDANVDAAGLRVFGAGTSEVPRVCASMPLCACLVWTWLHAFRYQGGAVSNPMKLQRVLAACAP